MKYLSFDNFNETQKGIIALVAGLLLLAQALNVFKVFQASLNTIMIFIALFFIIYGVLKLELITKVMNLLFGKSKNSDVKK